MKYESYIFDLDGTLLNTLNDLAASCNFALSSYGLPERSIDDVRRFVGNGVRLLMTRAIPGGESFEQFDECYACFRQHYLHHNLDTTAPYPGIMELISQLNANGKKIAVVSNKFYQATQELVHHFFGDEIKVAIGERPDIHKKPAPDTVIEALRQLDMPTSTAVYIGDSDVDIDTAHNCGMPCISVLWGFRDREFLIEHGATTLVKNPNDILSI